MVSRLLLALVVVAWLLGAASPAAAEFSYQHTLDWLEAGRDAAPEFAPGDTLARADLARIAPFVPPGFLAEFDFENFAAEIQAPQRFDAHALYTEASLQYGRTTSPAGPFRRRGSARRRRSNPASW